MVREHVPDLKLGEHDPVAANDDMAVTLCNNFARGEWGVDDVLLHQLVTECPRHLYLPKNPVIPDESAGLFDTFNLFCLSAEGTWLCGLVVMSQPDGNFV